MDSSSRSSKSSKQNSKENPLFRSNTIATAGDTQKFREEPPTARKEDKQTANYRRKKFAENRQAATIEDAPSARRRRRQFAGKTSTETTEDTEDTQRVSSRRKTFAGKSHSKRVSISLERPIKKSQAESNFDIDEQEQLSTDEQTDTGGREKRSFSRRSYTEEQKSQPERKSNRSILSRKSDENINSKRRQSLRSIKEGSNIELDNAEGIPADEEETEIEDIYYDESDSDLSELGKIRSVVSISIFLVALFTTFRSCSCFRKKKTQRRRR